MGFVIHSSGEGGVESHSYIRIIQPSPHALAHANTDAEPDAYANPFPIPIPIPFPFPYPYPYPTINPCNSDPTAHTLCFTLSTLTLHTPPRRPAERRSGEYGEGDRGGCGDGEGGGS